MKKRFLAMFLALVMCLALLPAPALAAVPKTGDTTVTDANGITYKLSNPISAIEHDFEILWGEHKGVYDAYVVPEGTTIVPQCPAGYTVSETGFQDPQGKVISIINFCVEGIGNVGLDGYTVKDPAPESYGGKSGDRYYHGIGSISEQGREGALVFLAGTETNPAAPTTPDQPATPDKPAVPDQSGMAYASTQNVLVDGKAVEFQAYALKDANGNDTNYVKLRDVAYALNGTAAQFSVGWDQTAKSISVTSGQPYEANGTEMKTPYSGNRAYTVSSSPLYINGKAADLEAILLTDDAGSGYTYFKLRDLGQLLNFNVMWNGSSIVVESDKPYTG